MQHVYMLKCLFVEIWRTPIVWRMKSIGRHTPATPMRWSSFLKANHKENKNPWVSSAHLIYITSRCGITNGSTFCRENNTSLEKREISRIWKTTSILLWCQSRSSFQRHSQKHRGVSNTGKFPSPQMWECLTEIVLAETVVDMTGINLRPRYRDLLDNSAHIRLING